MSVPIQDICFCFLFSAYVRYLCAPGHDGSSRLWLVGAPGCPELPAPADLTLSPWLEGCLGAAALRGEGAVGPGVRGQHEKGVEPGAAAAVNTHVHQVGRREKAYGQHTLNKGDWLRPSLTGCTERNIGTLTPPLVAGSKQNTLQKDMSSLSSAGAAHSDTYYRFLNMHCS